MKTLQSEMDMPNNTYIATSTVEVSSNFQISAQTAFPEDLHTVTETIPRVSTDPPPPFWGFFNIPSLRFNTHRSDMRAAV